MRPGWLTVNVVVRVPPSGIGCGTSADSCGCGGPATPVPTVTGMVADPLLLPSDRTKGRLAPHEWSAGIVAVKGIVFAPDWPKPRSEYGAVAWVTVAPEAIERLPLRLVRVPISLERTVSPMSIVSPAATRPSAPGPVSVTEVAPCSICRFAAGAAAGAAARAARAVARAATRRTVGRTGAIATLIGGPRRKWSPDRRRGRRPHQT